MFEKLTEFIREKFGREGTVPLHAPLFIGNEKLYLGQCIDSTYVSYLGSFVTKFEEMISDYTGAKYAIATVNGTSSLHLALLSIGIKPGDEVITQPVSFVATCNAIRYCSAEPVFVDIDRDTLGLSPEKLSGFLSENSEIMKDGSCYNKLTGKRIKACVPVHVFGNPCRIDEIVEICSKYNISVIEDSAQALGSIYKDKHAGTIAETGIYSFNGNKIITTGGGGMLVTNNPETASLARHISTTAKLPHQWEFNHDKVGYNYRMPNVNAAVGVAQMEKIDDFLLNKRNLAREYIKIFNELRLNYIQEPMDSISNFWLNSIIFNDIDERNSFLEFACLNEIQARPLWTLLNELDMYRDCFSGNIDNARYFSDRVVSLPSSVIYNQGKSK